MATVPRFAAAAHRPARRRLWEAEAQSPLVRLMIGNAIGDAFGFGIEMQDAHWIRKAVTRFDEWPQNHILLEQYRRNNVRGFYSEDAEMTVGLMKALVAHGSSLDRDTMLRAWKDEWEVAKTRPPPAVKGLERQGHGGIGAVWRGETTLESLRERQAAREDPGNAAPMRALPIGFVADANERVRLCIENADATHPHPRARAAAFLIATACRHLIVEGGERSTLLHTCTAALKASTLSDSSTLAHLDALSSLGDYHAYGARFSAMPRAVHATLCGPQPCPFTTHPCGSDGTSRMEGICSDAMRTAGAVLYLCQWASGPLDVLTASIDLGGDVDSVASLCLGLVGGSDGLRFGEAGGLSWRLLEELEGVEYLLKHAKAFEAWLAKQPPPKPVVAERSNVESPVERLRKAREGYHEANHRQPPPPPPPPSVWSMLSGVVARMPPFAYPLLAAAIAAALSAASRRRMR